MFEGDSFRDGFIKTGEQYYLYTYTTRHLLKKDKIRFFYALKGRDGKSGIVKNAKIVHLGKTVLLVPVKSDEDVQQFMKIWNLPYTKRRAVVDDETLRGGPP
jgi:hypothetical protein